MCFIIERSFCQSVASNCRDDVCCRTSVPCAEVRTRARASVYEVSVYRFDLTGG
jgi:hypothetical protein